MSEEIIKKILIAITDDIAKCYGNGEKMLKELLNKIRNINK